MLYQGLAVLAHVKLTVKVSSVSPSPLVKALSLKSMITSSKNKKSIIRSSISDQTSQQHSDWLPKVRLKFESIASNQGQTMDTIQRNHVSHYQQSTPSDPSTIWCVETQSVLHNESSQAAGGSG